MTIADQTRSLSGFGLGGVVVSDDRGLTNALSAMRGGYAATRAEAWDTLDNLTGTRAAGEAMVRAAAPIQLAQAGAIADPISGPGSMSGLGWGANPIEVWEAVRLLRVGSLVGLTMF